MKKEIGGYFELEEFEKGYEYYPDFIRVNSARNAFLYYVKKSRFARVFLPYFLCSSVSELCKKENIKFVKYHINESMHPIIDGEIKDDDLLYIVNYYGQLDKNYIYELKNKYKNIIMDNVQCFYTEPINGVPTFYSCRKYFGVPDGAYLYANINMFDSLADDDSSNRMEYLYGRKNETAQKFYPKFLENEKLIDNLPLMTMSKITESIMKKIDNKSVIQIRDKNFKYLFNELKPYNKLNVSFNKGAFCYPFFINGGEELRKILISNSVYVPLLWPNVLNEGNELEKRFASEILPIPCDQRYSIEEMKYIVGIIKKYVEK